MAKVTPEQIAHIKQHQQAFDELMAEPTDVEEYFRWAEKDDIYERVCSDLGIEPLPLPVKVGDRVAYDYYIDHTSTGKVVELLVGEGTAALKIEWEAPDNQEDVPEWIQQRHVKEVL